MRSLVILFTVLVVVPVNARAFSLGEGDAGDAGQVLTVEHESVQLRFAGAAASMDNELIWDASPEGSLYCNDARVGDTFDLGSFDRPTQLDLFLRTPWAPPWSTGSGEQNDDGVSHARLTQTGPHTVLVGFEDSAGGGDHDYDDCRVELTIIPLE